MLKLWTVEADLVLAGKLPPLLPFVPVLKGGDEERVVQRALALLRAEPQLAELEPLLAFMASFALDSELVRRIRKPPT